MRFGVIGLGSMGRRRVRDLLALGHDVCGFDLRADRALAAREQMDIETVGDADALVARGLDALVISTPPDQHVPYYELSFEAGLRFFSEANILTPRPQWFTQGRRSGVRGYPSATWRFHPLVRDLRARVSELGLHGVRSVHHQYGSFLPRWHPWERYDAFYAGRARTSSAAREMVPFELEWLCWVFGRVAAVCGARSQQGDWTTNIDDTYALLLEFEGGFPGTLVVELHQLASLRCARVASPGESLWLDFDAPALRRYDGETGRWTSLTLQGGEAGGASCDWETVYLAEMRAFVDALEGRAPYIKDWCDDRHLSDVLYAAEESDRRRSWVAVQEVAGDYEGLDLT